MTVLTFDKLNLNEDDIFLSLGYNPASSGDEFMNIYRAISEEIERITIPRFNYVVSTDIQVGNSVLQFGKMQFNTGKVISEALKNAEYAALFIATTGIELDSYLNSIKQEGDIVREFISNAIAAEYAEATVREGLKCLQIEYSVKTVGNPYSPGYCGWNIREQRKIFSILPSDVCGVSLNESCLMSPVKSVSGIVAIGGEGVKAPYGCEICEMSNCYKNRAKI